MTDANSVGRPDVPGTGRNLVAEYSSRLMAGLGKGPGYVALGFAEALAGAVLVYYGRDVSGYAAVVTAVNVGVFGGGAWKVSAEARNGGGVK